MVEFPQQEGPTPEQMEMARICNLDVEEMLEGEDLEIFNFEKLLASAYDNDERLLPPQASAVKAYEDHAGGIFPIAVGWGKTGTCLMIAESAFQAGIKRSLLLIPIQQLAGLIRRHIPEWRRRVSLNVPFHMLAGRSKDARMGIALAGANGCYIYAYSLLSQSDAVQILDIVKPELIIADEVHLLKNTRQARGKRVMAFIRKHEPEFVGMSGTITSKSLADYQHLMNAALGDGSPIPRSYNLSQDWDFVINCGADGGVDRTAKAMRPLLRWAQNYRPDEKFPAEFTESYRRAYRHRMVTAPGVVATGDADIGVSLSICNNPVAQPERCDGWDQLKKFADDVKDYVTPNGDPIDHAFHHFKWLYELSAGFYNKLTWPDPEKLATSRSISISEAGSLLDRALIHHGATTAYHSVLREYFAYSKPGLDTPREVGLSMAQHGSKYIPADIYASWCYWKDCDFEGRPDREKTAIRVCSFKIDHAVKWAKTLKKNEGGIIWVYHQEVGVWLMEALEAAGLNPVHCPAGPKAGQLLESLGDPELGGKGERLVVASISSHGTGKNLQGFQRQLVFQFPRVSLVAEQLLGRLHRNGQMADHLDVDTCITTEHDRLVMAACVNDAIYFQQTTGAHQKVVVAEHIPPPTTFGTEFLREQGIRDIKRLNREQRELLKSAFA